MSHILLNRHHHHLIFNVTPNNIIVAKEQKTIAIPPQVGQNEY